MEQIHFKRGNWVILTNESDHVILVKYVEVC